MQLVHESKAGRVSRLPAHPTSWSVGTRVLARTRQQPSVGSIMTCCLGLVPGYLSPRVAPGPTVGYAGTCGGAKDLITIFDRLKFKGH
jgi:hypothetical protein